MRVPEAVRKCVAFLCYRTTNSMKLAGTCFFMHIPVKNKTDFGFSYIITAKHVIEYIKQRSIDQKVYVRFNLKDSGVKLMGASINRWMYHPQDPTVDVAVLNWSPPEIVDHGSLDVSMAATDKIIKTEEIGVGEEVFLTGLFVNHHGTERNIPIVRIGNIAAMPEERVQTKDLGPIDAYLVEARSIGGLSGSPVFAHLVGVRHVGKGSKLAIGKVYLLGLMHGHWDLQLLNTDELAEDMPNIEYVNMGIAIVIPASKILEVLDHPDLVKIRQAQ